MRSIFIISLNTFKEIMRDRILYGMMIFAVLLMGMSVALGSLSFTEQARISANFGFTGIHLSTVILSIFVGSTLVSREIDKKTILTLLAKPITRIQFLVGKAFGLTLVTLCSIGLLAFVMILLFWMRGIEVNANFFIGLYGIILESFVLLGMSLFFSSFTSSTMVVACCIGIFFIGHSLGSLNFFAGKSEDAFVNGVSTLVNYVIPNLERFNWRSLFTYDGHVGLAEVASVSLYSFLWFVFLVSVAGLFLRKKDFG